MCKRRHLGHYQPPHHKEEINPSVWRSVNMKVFVATADKYVVIDSLRGADFKIISVR
jgi:hypothetical protein